MIFQQYYLSCLSHASYLIGDKTAGSAVVVDPQRDVLAYLEDAERLGLKIQHVIETHIHADFVSGHLELAAQTGATICYGEAAHTEFPIRRLRDGERLRIGEVELEVRATPGHTPESIALVVYEHGEDHVPYGVLTGDTLFIGDVGRPDLLAGDGCDPQEMARQLYSSLHRRLLTLPDRTRVYPAHGAGSACGKNLSTETSSTIGEQRRDNYALRPMPEEEFVALVTEGQPARPAYFSYDAQRNRERHELLSEAEQPQPLSLEATLELQRLGAVLLDTRAPADFAAGHLRGALNVGLQGRFAEYAGNVIQPEQSIVLVSDPGTELEAKVRLGRIGFDTVVGYLREPMRALLDHPELVDVSSRLTTSELALRLATLPEVVVVDVRNTGELERGYIPGFVHLPLASLRERLDELDPVVPTVVHCASGYRSMTAASLLVAHGFTDVSDLLGGYEAWATAQRELGKADKQ
jgi:glyoxylase-like metal-dependent hydrolase (beta-lactamase superfamily II)/rhodanese-related sulfurtransferase